jgi:uncharacterized protein (DUF488 family)
MNTSYFARSSKHPNAVSIANITPSWYRGRIYKKLAPPYSLIKQYKIDKDIDSYTSLYESKILDELDPLKTYYELGASSILLCYENPKVFCHRHIVARWLNKHLGVEITELL